MRRRERIPLHDHSGFDAGGLVAQSTIVTLVNSGGTSGTSTAPPVAADVPIADVGGYFTAGNVEDALAELGAGGSGANDTTLSTVAAAGATETLDVSVARTHDVTVDADCTFSFTGAATAEAWFFTLILRQDGTGGWVATWPGAVVWPGGVAPTLDTTASTAEVLTFFTVDGGTTWYGFHAGSGTSSVAALDDLTDVAITAAAEGQTLYYRSGTWVNEATPASRWELVVTGSAPPVAMTNDAEDDFLYAEV